MPSLRALVTLAVTPAEFGRVLAGFSVIESIAVALRTPLLFGLYTATLSGAPNVVWRFGAALFMLSAAIVMNIRPARFTRRREEGPAATSGEDAEVSAQ